MILDAAGWLIRLSGAVISLGFIALALLTVGDLTRAATRPPCPDCGLRHPDPHPGP